MSHTTGLSRHVPTDLSTPWVAGRAASGPAGFVLLALLVHFAIGPAVGPYPAKILLDIGINVILAVSLNIVNGFTGQFSIGHAAFMAVGGYTSVVVTYYGGVRLIGAEPGAEVAGLTGVGLFFAATVCGALVAGLCGYVVGIPSLRLKGDYLALVTLGFGEIVRVLLQQTPQVITKKDAIEAASPGTLALSLGGALGFTAPRMPTYTNLMWVWLWVGAMLLFAYRLKESTHGRAYLAVREDEVAAEAMGIPTTRIKVRAFVMAAAFAGIAGALFAHENGTTLTAKELGFQKSFEVVIMAVLGGMGSISGAALAAAALTVLPEVLRDFSEYRMIVYALLLVLVMLLRPQGLFGLHEAWELPQVRRAWRRLRGGR